MQSLKVCLFCLLSLIGCITSNEPCTNEILIGCWYLEHNQEYWEICVDQNEVLFFHEFVGYMYDGIHSFDLSECSFKVKTDMATEFGGKITDYNSKTFTFMNGDSLSIIATYIESSDYIPFVEKQFNTEEYNEGFQKRLLEYRKKHPRVYDY